MRLLLSLFDDPLVLENGTDRKSSLLLVDTSTRKKRFINTPVLESKHCGATGMDYSGDWLCLNMLNVEAGAVYSHLYLTHLNTGKTSLFSMTRIQHGMDIVSVYPGQIYINCLGTDSMVGLLFAPTTGRVIREDPHFTLPNSGYGCFKFYSMCNYKNKWYGAIWEDGRGTYNGSVLELSNQRAIFSNCNKPNSIFFNSNHRLCFCEGGSGFVHLGDMTAYISGLPQGIIEDRDSGGYWVATQLNPGSKLVFIGYDGDVIDHMDLGDLRVYRIIEARGAWLNRWYN
jgi:hypothetical protein